MAQTFEGQVEITGAANRVQINLDATSGGLAQLFHPNGGNPHIELVANEIAPHNTGGGLVNVTNGGGITTIILDGHAETIEAPVHQSTGGLAVLSGANGGLLQLWHPNRGNPHVELSANETDPANNTGGGLINLTNGGGNKTIQLTGHAGRGAGLVSLGDGSGNTTVAMGGQVGGGGAIQLTNVNNVLTILLVQNPSNGGDVSLFAANGTPTVGIGQDVAAAGAIELSGPNGNPIVNIGSGVGASNSGNIELSGPNGNPIVNIGSAVGAPNFGFISLHGPNNQNIVRLGNALGLPNNGFVGVQDATGAHTASMTFDLQNGNSLVRADEIRTSGSMSFSAPHPTQPDTDIIYACIEGPEAAVFIRGTAHLVNGEARVPLPDHFAHVANLDTMTVHVTPLSADSVGLAVVAKGPAGFVVRELQRGSGNYGFDWDVKCVRRGHEDYRVLRPRAEMVSLDGQAALRASPRDRIHAKKVSLDRGDST
jgi:hypothetical protein